ncbi:MAG: hypothetical protein LC808_40680, partial [Actinobacteria bacterium]|nr:hypothetical protein [Actinomycetota bacterium]
MTAIAPPARASEKLDALAASPHRTSGQRLLGDLRRTVLVDLHARDLVLRLASASAAIDRQDTGSTEAGGECGGAR